MFGLHGGYVMQAVSLKERYGVTQRVCCIFGVVALMVGWAVGVSGYHTPDHFCEQCISDNCVEDSADDIPYLDCVLVSCGNECQMWAADRGGFFGEECTAQCETVWQVCISASEDSGGLIDDYCSEAAQDCYAHCRGDMSHDIADDSEEGSP